MEPYNMHYFIESFFSLCVKLWRFVPSKTNAGIYFPEIASDWVLSEAIVELISLSVIQSAIP